MSIDDTWNSADPDAREDITLDPPADGDYTAVLVEAHAGIGKESQRAFVALTWQDVASEYKWKVLGGFKSSGQANVTKGMVRDLGVDVDSLHAFEEVGEALKPLAGGYYSLSVKTNGTFRNTYINGPARVGQSPAAEPGSPTSTDEVPF